MAQPFRSLWEKMSPEAQAAAEQKMQAMQAAMPLQELQQARHRAHEHLTTIGAGHAGESRHARTPDGSVHQHAAQLHRGYGRRPGDHGDVSGGGGPDHPLSRPGSV
jgi:hypothetical protein